MKQNSTDKCRLCRKGIMKGDFCPQCALLMAQNPAVGQLIILLLGRVMRLEYYIMKLEKKVYPSEVVEGGASEELPPVGLKVPLQIPKQEEPGKEP